MSEKFKYAPGKPGFGSKGDTGIAGQQGFSIYFTDYNPTTQSVAINSRISNNHTLWVGSDINLPGDRVYVTGDLFIDSEGKTYEIDASTHTFSYKFASLNLGGLFTPLGVTTSEGYERYFNSNTGSKYIVDNIYTSGGTIDYTSSPASIYEIEPEDFTRIEFTNVKQGNGYNAFSVYSINSADKDALAIVYDETNSLFRIGNLADDGSVRNTNLIFDISSLRINRDKGPLSVNSPMGSILTNYEINANSLFDPNFTSNPSSFYAISDETDCSIFWRLTDFTLDTSITASLYFHEQINTFDGSIINIDASSVRPLIFEDVDTSAYIKITGLKSGIGYKAYMKFNKNGWERKSDPIFLYYGSTSVTPTSYSISSSASENIPFTVLAPTGLTWYYTVNSNPDTFMYSITSVSDNGYDGSIYVDVSANATVDRTGEITVYSTFGEPRTIEINQNGPIELVTFEVCTGYPVSYSITDPLYTKANMHAEISVKATGMPAYTMCNMKFDYRRILDNNALTLDLTQIVHTVKLYNSSGSLMNSHPVSTVNLAAGGLNYLNELIDFGSVGISTTDWPLLIKIDACVGFNGREIAPSKIKTTLKDFVITKISGSTPTTFVQPTQDASIVCTWHGPIVEYNQSMYTV